MNADNQKGVMARYIKPILAYFGEKLGHSSTKKHAANLSWMFFGRIATMATSFLATAIMARNLGPTNFGQLSYAISFTGLFGFIAGLGIDQILFRELSRKPEQRDVLTGTSLILSIGAGIVAMVISIIAAFVWSPHDISLLLIVMISTTFVTGSFTLIGGEFQSQHRAKWPTLLSITIVIFLNTLKIAIILLNKGIIFLAGIIVLEPILYAAGYLWMRARFHGAIKLLSFDIRVAKAILRDSLPLIFVSVFASIYSRIDQVFLKNMIDADAVGTYDAAVRLSEFWYFIPNIIISGLIPTIIRARESSYELYIKRSQKLFLAVTITTLLIAIFSTALAVPVTSIIFGNKFALSATILQIYIWSNIGAAITLYSQQVLIAENYTWPILYSSFLGMLVNVGLCILLIPHFGGVGAAIASLIAYPIPFASLFFIPRTRKLLWNIITGSHTVKHV